MLHLCRRGGFLCKESHTREHAVEIKLLLVAGAPNRCLSLSADCQNGRMVQFGVIQTGKQVRSARTPGRQTDSDLTGELGVGDSHESRHLLVADLNEVDLV